MKYCDATVLLESENGLVRLLELTDESKQLTKESIFNFEVKGHGFAFNYVQPFDIEKSCSAILCRRVNGEIEAHVQCVFLRVAEVAKVNENSHFMSMVKRVLRNIAEDFK